MSNAERVWRGLPLEHGRGAHLTVEAVMHSLRARGVTALQEQSTQRRLSELSAAQLQEVISRLEKLRSRYPLISPALLAALGKIK